MNTKLFLLAIVVTGSFSIIGKLMMYWNNLDAYNQEMKYRRKFPHPTNPPQKPTLFNKN